MKVRTAPLIAALLAFVALAFAACSGGDSKDTLVIAVQPAATQQELSSQASEIEAFLEERVDANIELRFPTTYAGVIESLRFGHADAAFMSAWPAQLANENAGAEVVLAEVREVTIGDESAEETFYYSYWVVLEDSEYQSLDDLSGKAVAFSSQLSTSGYVAPMGRLTELGYVSAGEDTADPNDYFGEVLFAGGYSQAWEALRQGQVDVSIIAGDVPADLYKEVLANTRVIEEQGPVPSHSVVFSKDLEDPLRSDLRDALLELGTEENRGLMRQFISGIFLRFESTTTEEHLGALSRFLEDTRLAYTETIQ